MPDTKHTPGPWHAHEDDRNFFVDSASHGSVCKIAVNHHEDANARLIAAAPELLATLEEFLAKALSHWSKGGVVFDKECLDAEAAIRKAKGE